MKLVTVIGARPQFIKAATVSRQVQVRSGIEEVLVHTGQHFDANMSKVFFDDLAIPEPKYNLGIGGGLHGAMTGRQLEAVEAVLLDEKPDWVLVYGDTNSTLAGALAAAKLNIPVAHVEAGLRSFNRTMPEEINRVLTDHISTLLFTPTSGAQQQLLVEGVSPDMLRQVGDVMFDACIFYKNRFRRPAWATDLECGEYVLATVHRAENTDDALRLGGIFDGLGATSRQVVLPLHPRTRAKLSEFSLVVPGNVRIVDPVGYLEMGWLLTNAAIVATDSGGVQKEAFFCQVPCLTLREETEWKELCDLGVNRLVGADAARISEGLAAEFSSALFAAGSPYGEGRAAELILESLLDLKL